MNAQCRIREARPDDAGDIARILAQSPGFPSCQLEPGALLEHVRAQLAEMSARRHSHLLAAENGQGRMQAFMSLHMLPFMILPGPEAYLAELFVAAESRGMGIGRMLLARAREMAAEQGCYRLMLLNSRDRDSYQRGFYAKNGWQERPRVANFISLVEGE